MSSLRPLITITLLGFVGVVLYMKINDAEPVLPTELAGQSWGADVEVGAMDVGGIDAGASPAALPPATFVDAAPAWTPPATIETKPAATTPAANGGLAPSFSAAATETNPAASAAATATSDVPAMPALPGMENGASTTTSSAKAASEKDAADKGKLVAAAGVGAATAAALDNGQSTPAPPFAPPSASAATTPGVEDLVIDQSPVTPNDPFAAPTSPVATTPLADSASLRTGGVMFPEAMIAVQAALDRGELAQGLTMLSEWYGDPSLAPNDKMQVETLLGQLAGSVIYEGPPAHRLEPAHIVQAGETLQAIAAKYSVSPELLAKINALPSTHSVEPGQELKVVRGPFSATIDLSDRRLTLMLDRRYAGKFDLELDSTASVEEGQWTVAQKNLTPAPASIYGQPAGAPTEDRTVVLTNPANPASQAAVLRGPATADPVAALPKNRVIGLKQADVADVFDILSEGSRVTIRR